MEENADQKIATTESPPSYDSIAPPTTAVPQPTPQPGPYPPTGVPLPYPPPPGAYGGPTYYYVQPVPVQPAPRRQPVQSFTAHICFACIVLWCINWLFGLIAFILAMVASGQAASQPDQARKLGYASLGVSVAGIIVTIIIVIIIMSIMASKQNE